MSLQKLQYLKFLFLFASMLFLIGSTNASAAVFAQNQDLSIPVFSPQELKTRSEPFERNGCGSSGGMAFPDTYVLGGELEVNFSQACNDHDVCYGTLGSDRATCDAGIYTAMVAACQEAVANGPANISPRLAAILLNRCKIQSSIYYRMIRLFASSAYETGQNVAADHVAGSLPVPVMILPEAQIGRAYNQTIIGENGIAPYRFGLRVAQLPFGITLTTGGNLIGVPNRANSATTFKGVIVVKDSAGWYGARRYTLQISASTPTPTNTDTPTLTNTLTFTPTNTDTPTWTPTNTDTPTPTNTLTFTPTNTDTPTPTATTCSVPFSFTMLSSHDLGAASYYLQDCGTQIEMNVVVPANMSTPGTTGNCGRGDGIVGARLYPPNMGEIGWYILAGQGQGLNICHGADETFGPFYFPYIPGSYLEFFAGTVSTSTAYITVR